MGGNGTGKSTLLKILCGMESLDYGSISCAKGIDAGLPSAGRPTLSGPHGFRRMHERLRDLREMEQELETLHHKMGELDPASAEYAHGRGPLRTTSTRIPQSRRLRDRGAGGHGARRPGLPQGGLDAAHRRVLRRLADAHRAGQAAAGEAQPAAAGRAHESPGSRSAQLAGDISDELSERLHADFARPLFPGCDGRQAPSRSGTSESTSTAATTRSTCSRRPSAARSSKPPTAISASASSNWKPSSTASAIRRPRPSRSRAASRNSTRSSASRSRPKSRRFTSPFRSPSPAGASWPSSRTSPRATAQKHVFSGANFIIERGDRIALVGVNGAGKSTLIKLLAGTEPLTSGSTRWATTSTPDYFAQDQYKELDPDARMLDDLSDAAPRATQTELRSLLGCFLFSEDDVFKTDRRALGRRAQPLRAGADAAGARRISCCSTSPRITWTCAPRTCCWRR